MDGSSATFTKEGAGTLFLTANSDLVGKNLYVNITSTGGVLSLGDGSARLATATTGFVDAPITNNSGLWFNRTDSFTFSKVISGTGSVYKKAAGAVATGVVTLTGANTYEGGTFIESGTLRVGDGTAAGSLYAPGTISISAGAELRFDNSNDRTSTPTSGIISGGGSVYKAGTGRVNLSGFNTYLGTTTVANGWLVVSHGSALGAYVPASTAGTTVLSGATLAFQNAIVVSEAIGISGMGYSGAGALRNSGAMGDINVLAGQVTLSADSSIVADLGTLEVRKIGVTANQNLTVTGKTTPIPGHPSHQSKVWLSGVLSLGSGKLTKDGGGIADVSAVAAYTGGLLVKDGQFAANSISALGQGADAFVDVGVAGLATSPVLNVGLDLTYAGTVTLHNGSIIGSHKLTSQVYDFELRNGTVSACLDGSVKVRKSSVGTVVLQSANTFTGNVSVEAGTLKIVNNNALGDLSAGTAVTAGATLEFGLPSAGTGIVVSEQVSIAGSGHGNVGALRNTSGNNTLASQLALSADAMVQVEAGSTLSLGDVTGANRTLTANAINVTVGSSTSYGTLNLGGLISMAGGKVVKIGTGTLNINAAANFNGGMSGLGLDVQSGTVRANHVDALGVGRVQVGTALAGATLDIGVDVNLNNTLTLLHGTISSGKTYGAHMLTASLFDLRDGVVTASLNGNTGLDKIADGSLTSGVVTLLGNNIYTGQTNVKGGLLLVGSNGLGATGAGNDTVVGYDANLHTWGTLALRTGARILNEVITIAGDGYDKLGALRTFDDGGIEEVARDIVIADVNGGGLNRARINNYDADQGNDGDEAFVLAGISGINQDLYFGAWKSPADSDGKIYVNGSISLGSGKLVSEMASSSGVLTLNGANSFSGGAEIRSGKLVAAHANAMGSGPIIVGTWNFLPTEEGQATVAGSRVGVFRTEALLQNLGNITLVNGVLEGLYSISSPLVELQSGKVNVSLAGSGSVRKTTASTVSLSVANTYDGETRVEGGILDLLNSSALGSSLGSTYVDAGTLRLGKTKLNILDEQLFLNGHGLVVSSVAQGALNVSGSATTFSGAIRLQSTSRINSDSSSFTLNGASSLGYDLASGGSGYDLYLGGKGNIYLYKQLDLGTGKLIKDSAGVLYIRANESVEGVSLVKGSTVLSGATVTTQAAGFSIGATAALSGYGTIVGDVIFKNGIGATLTPGNRALNPGAGAWSLNTGNLTFEGAAKVAMKGNVIKHSLVSGFLQADPLQLPYPYDYANVGNGVAPVVVTGDINLLSAPSSINVAFSGARVRSGVYKIMEFSGSVIGGDFSGMGPSPFRATGIRMGVRQSASFRKDLLPQPRLPGEHGFITLEISTGALRWRGDNTNEWDLGEYNWFLDSHTNPAQRVNFLQNDLIVFDDSATGPTDILVKPYAARLNPVVISFENTDASAGGKDYRLYRGNDGYVSLGHLVTAKDIYVGDLTDKTKIAGKVTLSTATSIIDEGEEDQGFHILNGWVRAGHDAALGGLRVFLMGGRLSAEGSGFRSMAVSDAFYLQTDDFRFGSSSDVGAIRLESAFSIDSGLNGTIDTDSHLELAAGVI
ncbi:MAG: beta strand repeat-containing protein [Nitrospiraceae bacterium]